MATMTTPTGVINNSHVESVSPNEWEDEAFADQSGDPPADGQAAERQTKVGNLRSAAAALRSSFNALRPSSASLSGGPKASPSGRRDSVTGGFVGSLLHGLANAVGLHRDSSPSRDASPGPCDASFSRSRRTASQTHPHSLARLSSAALMRSEIQNLSQFGDLRNDSFTSRSCSRVRRRSSLLLPRASDVSIIGPMLSFVPPGITPAGSGDLSTRSVPAPPLISSSRLTCPGELPSPGTSPTAAASPYFNAVAVAATAAALATPPPREQPKPLASPFHTPPPAAPPPPHPPGGAPAAAIGATAAAGGLRARRSSSGAPQLQRSLLVEIPSLPTALSPHPPSHPPPQTRPSGSSLSPQTSRSISSDHLPPMTPGSAGPCGLLSVRDRPPTPRGARTSSTGSPSSALAKVLGSFHLPEIITSGKSVTERRSSVAGGGAGASFTRPADFGMPRSRRNSICSGPSITGPGGAAISASIAKRTAAAVATSSAAAPSGGGGGGSSCLTSPVAPSGPSFSTGPQPSGPSYTRLQSQQGNSILQEFQNSLELDEEKALAAVDAEFDRRFGQPPQEVPGAVDAVSLPPQQQRPSPSSRQQQQQQPSPNPHLQPLSHHPQQPQPPQGPQLPAQPQPPNQTLAPKAPASERTTPQNLARRPFAMASGSASSASGASGSAAAGGGDGGGGLPVICHAPRRLSCSATLSFDQGDDTCADQGLLTSMDAISLYERNSNKMRLASIRLSYADGIVGGPITVGGGRASLDLPPAALTARGSATGAACAQPSPAVLPADPRVGRHPAPVPPAAAVAAVAAVAAGGGAAL